MGLFAKKPSIRPTDSYEVDVPENYEVEKKGNKLEIKRIPGQPVNGSGRPVNYQETQDDGSN